MNPKDKSAKVEVEEDAQLQGIRFLRNPPQPRKADTMQGGRGLFIRNVPRELTNKDLMQLFSEHGKVVSVYLKPSGPGAKFNWSIINTENVKDMLSMMTALNRKPPFNFDITVALSEDEKKRRKEMESLPVPGCPAVTAQGGWNGAASHTKVTSPAANGVLETGKGAVVTDGGRRQACVFCGSQGHMRCSVCKAWYCSMVCQADDWYHHKNTCRAPPVLDDPWKVQHSLCGAGGEVQRGAGAAVLPASPFTTDGKHDVRKATLEEGDPCAGKEMQATKNIGSTPEDHFLVGLSKVKTVTNNSCSGTGGRGAIPKTAAAQEGIFGAGRGAISRGSMTESRIAGGCSASVKGSSAGVNVTGKATAVQEEAAKSPRLKCAIPKTSISLADKAQGNAEKSGSISDLEHFLKPPVTGEPVTGTTEMPSRSEESRPAAVQDEGSSSVVSSSECAAENQMQFLVLLEEGKVYDGFITLVDTHEHFVAISVVEGTEFMFSEAHQILSTAPPGVDFKPEVGTLVAAYSPLEETWYRARVLEVDGSRYRVCYVDFGNKETVWQIKPIPKGPFSELPELAFQARLSSCSSEHMQAQLKKMVQANNSIKFKVVAKKELQMKAALLDQDDESGTAIAEFILAPLLPAASPPAVPPSPPSQTGAAAGAMRSSMPHGAAPAVAALQETRQSAEKQTCTENDDTKESRILALAEEPSKKCNSSTSQPRDTSSEAASLGDDKLPRSCYVVPLKNIELLLKVEEMYAEMREQCGCNIASSHQPMPGEACLAKSAEDDQWYRALCVTSSSSSARVIFVDYGSVESVCLGDIRPLLKRFLEVPCLALYHLQEGVGEKTKKQQEETAETNAFTFLTPLSF